MVDLGRLGEVRLIEGVPGGVPIPIVPGSNPSSFVTAQLLVTAAGTAEQLPSIVNTDGNTFVIKAKDGNTGKIYIGGSQADAEDPTIAFELNPSQGVMMNVDNTNRAWIDADVSGEGVDIITVSKYAGGGGGGGSAASNQPTFRQGQVRPAAAGAAEQIPSQAVPNGFAIFGRAFIENNDTVYIGRDEASAEDPTVGTPLEPGAFFELALTDTDAIWVNSLTTGDGIYWYVEAAS